MRFQQICDPLAQSAARDRLAPGRDRLAPGRDRLGRGRGRLGRGRGRAAAAGLLAAAACGLAVTACGSQASPGASAAGTTAASAKSPDSPSPAGDSSSPAACTTSGISVTLTNTGALGGQAGGYLKFTDQGRVPCRMTGWPVVVAVTTAGTATAARHAQSTMFGAWRYAVPLPVVVLKTGDSAYAVVAASDEPAGSSTHCPAPYVRLRVSPPGDRDYVTISAWLPGARSYLPACTAIDGSPTAMTSAMTTLSRLPH
jgi:Protein of unknown function (DUF4232)